MEERRKNRRMELTAALLLKGLNGEADSEVSIEIIDVSKTGIGFICTNPLNIGAVYEADLTIWTKEVLHVFLEIVRIEKLEKDEYSYGAIFIGMSEIDSKRIEVYQTIETMETE
ncbi:MAG: PilZ domain-containing protein [Lachnospiraceae bacterium]|nr:PilZ domain-containing protein [Lachnospiraceae bacterium]